MSLTVVELVKYGHDIVILHCVDEAGLSVELLADPNDLDDILNRHLRGDIVTIRV